MIIVFGEAHLNDGAAVTSRSTELRVPAAGSKIAPACHLPSFHILFCELLVHTRLGWLFFNSNVLHDFVGPASTGRRRWRWPP
jgi:hypothetical protein